MYDLKGLSPGEVAECGAELRRLGSTAASMEEAANRIVGYLYDNLVDGQTSERCCALVRFYKTHPYGELEEGLQQFVQGLLGAPPESPETKCLTLLATAGERPEWNDRAKSEGHRAIPLASEKMVAQIPMIAQLVSQFGLEVSSILKPDPSLMVDMEQKTYNTFYIPQALGSPYILAQDDFVAPFGVQSVLGCGGVLASGDLFALIMFSKTPVTRETAENVRALAADLKEAVQPFVGGAVFA